MKVITLPIRGGKTEAMLKWMREAPEGEHRVCVCYSQLRAMNLYRDSRDREMGLESWQFVGPDEVSQPAWSGVLYGRGGRVVVGFDDLDLWLQGQSPFEIGAVSLTTEETE